MHQSARGPPLPTCTADQVVSYLRYRRCAGRTADGGFDAVRIDTGAPVWRRDFTPLRTLHFRSPTRPSWKWLLAHPQLTGASIDSESAATLNGVLLDADLGVEAGVVCMSIADIAAPVILGAKRWLRPERRTADGRGYEPESVAFLRTEARICSSNAASNARRLR